MLYLVGFVISLLTLASPIIAIIAVVQWVNISARKKRNGGLSDYQVGYRDGSNHGSQPSSLNQSVVVDGFEAPIYSHVAAEAVSGEPQSQSDFDETGMNLVEHQSVYETPKQILSIPRQTPERDLRTTVDIERAKSSRTLSALLLLGSLLFVAAGIAFVVSGYSDATKLVGLIIIVAIFYGSGMIIYPRQKVLRPAAVAFIGIGLALLPFLGVALVAYSSLSPQTAWLLISTVGIVAYVAASMLLQSQFVSYLTMAFVLSLATSGVASASLPLFWYFVVLIVVSLLASVVSLAKPRLLPNIFKAPVQAVGTIVTPVVLVGSLLLFSRISLLEYEIVFAVATMQYGVTWLQSKNERFETITRTLAQATLVLIAIDAANSDIRIFASLFIVIAAAQQVYSLVRYRLRSSGRQAAAQTGWLIAQFALLWSSLGIWAFVEKPAEYMLVSLGAIFLMGVLSATAMRRISWAYNALAVTLIAPLHVALLILIVQPSHLAAVVAIHLGLAAVSIMVYRFIPKARTLLATRYFSYITTALHFGLSAIIALIVAPSLASALLWAAAIVVCVGASHVYKARHVLMSVPAFIYASVTVGVYVSTGATSFSQSGNLWISTGITTMLIYAGSAIYALLGGQRLRRNILLAAGHLMVLFTALALIADFIPVAGLMGGTQLAVLLLIVWTGLSVGMIRYASTHAPKLYFMLQTMYPIYYAVALLASLNLSGAWQAAAIGFGVFLSWEASYRFKQSWIVLLGNALVLWLSFVVVDLLDLPFLWKGVIALGGATAIQYFAAHVMLYYEDTQRSDVLRFSAWATALMLFLSGVSLSDTRPVALAVVALALIDATYRFRNQWPLFVAGLMVWWLATDLFTRVQGLEVWQLSLLAAALTAATLYAVMWLFDLLKLQKYRIAMQLSVVFVLMMSFIVWVWNDSARLSAAMVSLGLAAIVVIEGVRYKRKIVTEVGVYAAATAVCIAAEQLIPSLNVVAYAHVYAISIAAVCLWLRAEQGLTRYIVAMGILTSFVGVFALAEGGMYSMLFLAEHIALALAGAFKNARWALRWGIIGSVLATLYYLKDIPFLLFTILGVAVIGFVVWRLLKVKLP